MDTLVPAEVRDPWHAIVVYILLARMSLPVVALPLLGSRGIQSRSPVIYCVGILDLFAGRNASASFLGSRFVSHATYRASPPLGVAAGFMPPHIIHGARVGLLGWVITLVAMTVLTATSRGVTVEPHPNLERLVVWTATRWLRLARGQRSSNLKGNLHCQA